jgi:uncharacterized protein involved in exopolysaccharide biosynthesis
VTRTPSLSGDDDGISKPERDAAAQILARLEQMRATIKDLEDSSRRRVIELQGKLAELRATYAESHPTIVDAVQTIETLKQESPQLSQLRKEEDDLKNQYQALTAKARAAVGEGLTQRIVRSDPSTTIKATAEPSLTDDRDTEFAKNRLSFLAKQYDTVRERIEAARLELDAARAAFKYRYVVIHPARIPKDAAKPKAQKIVGGGVAGGLVLALLAAILMDLRSGRVYAPWQLERALRLPVLAEIRRDP